MRSSGTGQLVLPHLIRPLQLVTTNTFRPEVPVTDTNFPLCDFPVNIFDCRDADAELSPLLL